MSKLPEKEYRFLAELVKNSSGLILNEGMDYLVENRLLPLSEELGFKNVTDFIRSFMEHPSFSLEKRINEAMTTHESYFFRDGTPFEILKQHLLPEFHRSRIEKKELDIWSAACSSGQEAYSIAILFQESPLDWSGWTIRIHATDYSEAVLEKARAGIYTSFEVKRGLSDSQIEKYFDPHPSGFEVKPFLRRQVRFERKNLLEPILFEEMDLIFLRNVLIYFDLETKSRILNEIARASAPDGVLLLGGAESVYALSDAWSSIPGIEASIYRKTK